MGKVTSVTLETDGARDFVCLPDGVRYILGTVSVLKLVSALVPDRVMRRRALDDFNRTGQAMVALDVDRMFEFLAPKPLRKSAHGSSLIHPQEQAPLTSKEGTHMTPQQFLSTRIAHLENTIREMNSRVASGSDVSPDLLRNLRQAAISLPDFGDQSKNKAFYGLGEPEVDTVQDEGWTPPADVTHPVGKSASNLKASADVAERTLVKVADASDKVEALVAAGRRFNASKAQADLHRIASDVHALLENADMSEGWVRADLTKLAQQADRIHSLFATAR